MNSLIGCDQKITPGEQDFRNKVLAVFSLETKIKQLNKYIDIEYLPEKIPQSIRRSEIMHFIIWMLYFLACADKEIVFQEKDYIERVALALRLTKSNFDKISAHFIVGVV